MQIVDQESTNTNLNNEILNLKSKISILQQKSRFYCTEINDLKLDLQKNKENSESEENIKSQCMTYELMYFQEIGEKEDLNKEYDRIMNEYNGYKGAMDTKVKSFETELSAMKKLVEKAENVIICADIENTNEYLEVLYEIHILGN